MNSSFTPEDRFPVIEKRSEKEDGKNNPAIQLYGRRYFKDQSTVEYLTEMLLVFLSPKGDEKNGENSFCIHSHKQGLYWPQAKIALKLFSFFSGSKLETRHISHQDAYLLALSKLKENIKLPDNEKDTVIRLLQSLLNGFIGVSKNRTWVAQNFLPISPSLISREVGWRHTAAVREGGTEWEDMERHFDTGSHMFMARGGEMLFLQLAQLFSQNEAVSHYFQHPNYQHLRSNDLASLQQSVESNLNKLLTESVQPLTNITRFIESTLTDFNFSDLEERQATLGWIPTTTLPESFLFATELNNILTSNLPELEKLDILQILCSMQVLRNLCCQAYRTELNNPEDKKIPFIGQYIWVTADPNAGPGNNIRKLSQSTFNQVEQVLFRALESVKEKMRESGCTDIKDKDAHKHGFQIFRKISKDIGLVIPPTGTGQRFILTSRLLRFLVVSLIEPGQQIRLSDFYDRVFAHFGIALGERQLANATAWLGGAGNSPQYAITANTTWIEESLKQGGFLVELSDAVSIVRNTIGTE